MSYLVLVVGLAVGDGSQHWDQSNLMANDSLSVICIHTCTRRMMVQYKYREKEHKRHTNIRRVHVPDMHIEVIV